MLFSLTEAFSYLPRFNITFYIVCRLKEWAADAALLRDAYSIQTIHSSKRISHLYHLGPSGVGDARTLAL